MNKPSIFLLLFVFATLALNAQEKQYKIGAIGFYNFENLFDTIDTEDVRDTEFSPDGDKLYNSAMYYDKLTQLTTVVSEMGTELTPDGVSILGICEVENRSVLEDFVQQPKVKDRNYQIVHHDSPDKRGIDVALIYQPKYFSVTKSDALEILIYRDNGERKYTRDILYVEGLYDGEPMHIFVNHWPSRSGGEAASQHLRAAAAAVCKKKIDGITKADPKAKILIMGDLNDHPNSPSVKKVLAAKSNRESVKKKGLYNPYHKLYKNGIGSTAWRDTWGLFDQIIVSEGLVNASTSEGYKYYQAHIFSKPYMIQKTGQYKGYPMRTFSGDTYNGGYSDHFPSFVYLIKEL